MITTMHPYTTLVFPRLNDRASTVVDVWHDPLSRGVMGSNADGDALGAELPLRWWNARTGALERMGLVLTE